METEVSAMSGRRAVSYRVCRVRAVPMHLDISHDARLPVQLYYGTTLPWSAPKGSPGSPFKVHQSFFKLIYPRVSPTCLGVLVI